jgi:hypothetical protein
VITAGLLALVNQSLTPAPGVPRSAGPADGSPAAAVDAADADGAAAVAAMTPSSR